MDPTRWQILISRAMAAAAPLSTIRRCQQPTARTRTLRHPTQLRPVHQDRQRLGPARRSNLPLQIPELVASTGSKGTFIPDGTSLPERASNCATTVPGLGAQNVIDLPEIAFGAQTTLGYLSDSNWAGGTSSVADGTHNANIALLGNYMASSFATASDGHGGTLVAAEAAQPDQSLLSHPHHA